MRGETVVRVTAGIAIDVEYPRHLHGVTLVAPPPVPPTNPRRTPNGGSVYDVERRRVRHGYQLLHLGNHRRHAGFPGRRGTRIDDRAHVRRCRGHLAVLPAVLGQRARVGAAAPALKERREARDLVTRKRRCVPVAAPVDRVRLAREHEVSAVAGHEAERRRRPLAARPEHVLGLIRQLERGAGRRRRGLGAGRDQRERGDIPATLHATWDGYRLPTCPVRRVAAMRRDCRTATFPSGNSRLLELLW